MKWSYSLRLREEKKRQGKERKGKEKKRKEEKREEKRRKEKGNSRIFLRVGTMWKEVFREKVREVELNEKNLKCLFRKSYHHDCPKVSISGTKMTDMQNGKVKEQKISRTHKELQAISNAEAEEIAFSKEETNNYFSNTNALS